MLTIVHLLIHIPYVHTYTSTDIHWNSSNCPTRKETYLVIILFKIKRLFVVLELTELWIRLAFHHSPQELHCFHHIQSCHHYLAGNDLQGNIHPEVERFRQFLLIHSISQKITLNPSQMAKFRVPQLSLAIVPLLSMFKHFGLDLVDSSLWEAKRTSFTNNLSTCT